jgi:FAD/FMN-containing dehydrogenase
MKRRSFLQLSAQALLTATFAESLKIRSAFGAEVPVLSLKQQLDPADGQVLVPSDHDFANYLGAFNKRTLLTPQVRVLCHNAKAVVTALQWAKENQVPLAMRAGGHSYEGFSQSTGLVIDTRLMNQIEMSADATSFVVGAGALLGEIYDVVARRGVVIPAGSCPTVGVTGHSTGGGYGLIARGFGLACDSLLSFEMVLADGRVVTVNEQNYPDLFWACRGAGGGNFGVMTQLQFRTHRVGNVFSFLVSWSTTPDKAATLMRTWQSWAPTAPNGINPLLKVSKDPNGRISLRCIGQSIGTEPILRQELKRLTEVLPPGSFSVKRMPFLGAVKYFGGRETDNVTVYMKAKSDYLKKVWDNSEALGFLSQLPPGEIVAIFDSYGGAIRNFRDADTAFAHRENTVSSVQYYVEWADPKDTPFKLQKMRTFHDSVRPYFSGGAYSNYPDIDLPNYARAYWAGNLERLVQIKNSYDPSNLFQHAQSVPLRIS